MDLNIHFIGGAELLFDNKCEHKVVLPLRGNDRNLTISHLLHWIDVNLIVDKDRKHLLLDGATVRPGILILVNDVDWELLALGSSELKSGDTVTFLSTIHGG